MLPFYFLLFSGAWLTKKFAEEVLVDIFGLIVINAFYWVGQNLWDLLKYWL